MLLSAGGVKNSNRDCAVRTPDGGELDAVDEALFRRFEGVETKDLRVVVTFVVEVTSAA